MTAADAGWSWSRTDGQTIDVDPVTVGEPLPVVDGAADAEPAAETVPVEGAAEYVTVQIGEPFPRLSEIPRESAADTVAVAADMLASVRAWAPLAVAAGDFDTASSVRRDVATVADVIVKRGLSKGAALDAQEATRIAERTLGLCIRAGQDAGRIRAKGSTNPDVPSPREFTGGSGVWERVYRLTDGVTDEAFTAAVEVARDGGRLTAEAVSAALGVDNLTEHERRRHDQITAHAGTGMTSGQIGAELGITEQRVRELARRYGIDIPADVVIRKARVIDAPRVIGESLSTLDGVAAAVRLVSPDDIAKLDPAVAADWARQIWAACVPILHLRKGLNDRGDQ